MYFQRSDHQKIHKLHVYLNLPTLIVPNENYLKSSLSLHRIVSELTVFLILAVDICDLIHLEMIISDQETTNFGKEIGKLDNFSSQYFTIIPLIEPSAVAFPSYTPYWKTISPKLECVNRIKIFPLSIPQSPTLLKTCIEFKNFSFPHEPNKYLVRYTI